MNVKIMREKRPRVKERFYRLMVSVCTNEKKKEESADEKNLTVEEKKKSYYVRKRISASEIECKSKNE